MHRQIFVLSLLLIGLSPLAVPAGQAAPSKIAPRIAPRAETRWTQRQRDAAAPNVRGPVTNDVRVLVNHPDLLPGVMPFWNYIEYDGTLPARDRRILMLRTAWRSRSAYVWAKYATGAGADVLKIAAATTFARLDPFDATLLRAADGLHRASFIDDQTWRELSARYSTERLMDAVFTVAETSMLAMTMNSVRVPIDPGFATQRLPAGGERPRADQRQHPVLATPRIPPLEQTFWTGELRVLLDPEGTGRDIAAVYRTFARHPAMYAPRQTLSEYIRLHATLPARTRELAILRIGYLCGSDYEWGAHARAGRAAGLTDAEIRRIASGGRTGWNAEDTAIVAAADELYAGDTISDSTWRMLSAHLDTRQLLDFLITTGGYRMVSMALNTLGVPLEPGSETIPRDGKAGPGAGPPLLSP